MDRSAIMTVLDRGAISETDNFGSRSRRDLVEGQFRFSIAARPRRRTILVLDRGAIPETDDFGSRSRRDFGD